MRHSLIILLSLATVATSCKKTNPNISIPDGTYVGTFQRLTPAGGQISNVEITFSADNWTGKSEFAKYPALCRGKYKTSGTDNITFENECPWTADFDWTLILARDYNIKYSGKSIEISKDYDGAREDIYKLTKQ